MHSCHSAKSMPCIFHGWEQQNTRQDFFVHFYLFLSVSLLRLIIKNQGMGISHKMCWAIWSILMISLDDRLALSLSYALLSYKRIDSCQKFLPTIISLCIDSSFFCNETEATKKIMFWLSNTMFILLLVSKYVANFHPFDVKGIKVCVEWRRNYSAKLVIILWYKNIGGSESYGCCCK